MNPATAVPSLTSATFEDLVREMIVRIGEDPEREGLQRTPDRVRRSWEFLTRGYREDPDAMLRKALFTVTYDEMVIVTSTSTASANTTCCRSSARSTWPTSPTEK